MTVSGVCGVLLAKAAHGKVGGQAEAMMDTPRAADWWEVSLSFPNVCPRTGIVSQFPETLNDAPLGISSDMNSLLLSC